ncbi:MAG: electron transfer flavoprotein subunit alpha/FixB family protein, partial [Alphaproteobacteria bacterium]
GAGLVGDAVDLEVRDGRLIAWKPAFGGKLVAAITASSPIQIATVRAGALPLLEPRTGHAEFERRPVTPRGRIRINSRERDDELDDLASARVVIGLGQGVAPEDYPQLDGLRSLLKAELAGTRKVTDQGWLPRSRQVGVTGRAIAPGLFISLGASGKFNHSMGFRRAGTVLAINSDPEALVFDLADAGMVGDWREVVPQLVDELKKGEL